MDFQKPIDLEELARKRQSKMREIDELTQYNAHFDQQALHSQLPSLQVGQEIIPSSSPVYNLLDEEKVAFKTVSSLWICLSIILNSACTFLYWENQFAGVTNLMLATLGLLTFGMGWCPCSVEGTIRFRRRFFPFYRVCLTLSILCTLIQIALGVNNNYLILDFLGIFCAVQLIRDVSRIISYEKCIKGGYDRP